ncbi:MAG: ABC transporter permease [Acidimicrobiales bacterium]
MAARALLLTPALAPYWHVARRTFQRNSTYRGATFAGVVIGTVFGFLRAYVLLAVYRSRSTIGSFDAMDAVTFTFVSQGLLPTVGMWGRLELSDRIRSGDVATDLYRPLHFSSYWLAQDLGRFAYEGLARGIPPLAIGALVFPLRFPASPFTWALFLLAVVLAEVVSFGLRFLVALVGFWLIDNRGFIQFAGFVTQFFGGVIVPLSFFPGGLEQVARLLPFQAVIQLPVELFLGRQGAGALAVQALWAAALMVAGNAFALRAVRKVVVQGG